MTEKNTVPAQPSRKEQIEMLANAMSSSEFIEAVRRCGHWDDIAEDAVDEAIDTDKVVDAELFHREEVDADRLAEAIAAGDKQGAFDILREAFPQTRSLAQLDFLGSLRGTPAHLLPPTIPTRSPQ